MFHLDGSERSGAKGPGFSAKLRLLPLFLALPLFAPASVLGAVSDDISLQLTWDSGTSCSQVVLDPSFEAGTPNAFWSEYSLNFGTPLCSEASCGTGGPGPASGTWWAWFGGLNGAPEIATLSQMVTIPAGTATIEFRLAIPACANVGDDFFEVSLDGSILFSTDNHAPECDVQGYILRQIDVSDYADGNSHELMFLGSTQGQGTAGSVTNFLLDDVTLEACSAGLSLHWTGGTPPYHIFRGTDAQTVQDPGNQIGTTMGSTWVEAPPDHQLLYYLVTSAPTSCSQLVLDPSFEAGTPNAFWSEYSLNFGTPLCSEATCGTGGPGPATGTWWAWFGGLNGAPEIATLSQMVTIPAGTATIEFRLAIPACANMGNDVFEVSLDGTILFSADNHAPVCDMQSYILYQIDASDYADGNSHELMFRGSTEGQGTSGSVTNFFLDDVTLEACW